MNDKHITDVLDNTPFANVSADEMQTIRAHVEICAQCNRAFEAAQISALLIKERADEAARNDFGVNPFFQTRVLAAWRERSENVSALRRLWKATGALVATMTATTAALAVVTFVIPVEPVPDQTAALAPYSAESVMLDQSENEVSDEQVLNAIYAGEEDK